MERTLSNPRLQVLPMPPGGATSVAEVLHRMADMCAGASGRISLRVPVGNMVVLLAVREADQAPDQATPAEPFVPTPLQQAILAALDGKGLRTDALANKCDCNRGQLFNDRGGLPELQEEGLVAHHKRIGFYRPDAPPPELTAAAKTQVERAILEVLAKQEPLLGKQIATKAGYAYGRYLRATLADMVRKNLLVHGPDGYTSA